MGRTSRDEGSVHVLEAMVVASIMLSAIVFVVTYDQPVTPVANARGGLTQRADDALAILYDTPVDSIYGETALSAYVAECLNDDCDNLRDRLDSLTPEGSAYALYVSNGYASYPVLVEDGQPAGEAISATQSFEPGWSSTFLSTATDLVGVGDALLTYELPIYNSNMLSPGGSHLLVKLEGSRRDGSDFIMVNSYSTVARGLGDPTAFSAALYFVGDDDLPMAVHHVPDALDNERELILRLEETDGGEIPEGVQVDVELPRGWTGYAPDDETNEGWTILAAATDKNGAYVGSTITATLDDDVTTTRDLRLLLTYHGDVLDYYPVHARLSRGALASATILLRGEEHGGAPALATPTIGLSLPSPMGSGALDPTTWTFYAYAPVETSGFAEAAMSGEITVRRVEIREVDGNAIFGDDPQTITGPDGSEWVSTGDTLAWYPDRDTPFALTYDNPLNLSFLVEASGVAGPSDARAAFVPPVTFDTFTGKLVERTGWGIHRQAFLPADDEYEGFNDDSTGDGSWKAEHPLSTDAVYRTTSLPGVTSYNATILGSVEDALYGAYVSAQERNVAVGDEVTIDANVQSLLFSLADLNQKAGITTRIYAPWGRTLVFEEDSYDQGLLSGEVTQVALADLNGDSYPDPIVGTTNGRVLAYSGLTGQRIQGETFTAPVTAAAAQANTLPRINALAVAQIDGEPYIVVGTDKNSDGLFVLNKTLGVEWYWPFTGADVLAIDASTSFAGDADPEIAVTRSLEIAASKNALTYVFKANARTAEQIATGTATLLEPVPAATPVAEDADAFHYSLGSPTMISSVSRAGPDGDGPGLLVPTQTLLDPGITLNQDTFPPTMERAALSTPRAGLLGIDEDGVATSTLFGAPSSIVRAYDYGPLDANDADGVDDVAMGGASGYVILANGTVLTQPLYSYVLTGLDEIIDADTLSSAESYVLSEDGFVYMTDDTWTTFWGPNLAAPTANAIAASEPNEFWLVGAANEVWQGIPVVDPPTQQRAQMPPYRELSAPYTPTIADDPLYFVGKVYDFHDVWARDDEVWIVGSQCLLCVDMPTILHTSDAGATWDALGATDFALADAPDADLHSVDVFDGNVWIVGDDGNVLRLLDGETEWTRYDVGDDDLRDIACAPDDPTTCIIVGLDGAIHHVSDALGAPVFDDARGEDSLPDDKPFYSIGYQSPERIYIGSENAVFASFWGADWTRLPMNYLQNDARAVNALGDGTGYVYGGTPANARVWLLHDYHIGSSAQTIALGDELGLAPGAEITDVALTTSDVSLAGQVVTLSAATDGDNWETLGQLAVVTDDPTVDARASLPVSASFAGDTGRDLRIRVDLVTAGDKTITSPHVRSLTFDVTVAGEATPYELVLDFSDDALMDAGETDAAWDVELGALHQPLVSEYWTRSVGGEVLDIATGFDAGGLDDREDLWVATGDILAENSPDYIIYAQDPTDITEVVEPDNRVYILDGANGDVLHASDALLGEVRAIRIADRDENGVPEAVYAMTWDEVDGHLYDLDPFTLVVRDDWPIDLAGEMPSDMELGLATPTHVAAFVGTQRSPADADAMGHLWAIDASTQQVFWRSIPDELGKYEVKAQVEPWWFFGPYVVEVEVTWEETTAGGQLPAEVVRSARFYDHFMVTPPDLVSPPTPVYTARLLVWMRDWG